MEALWEVLRKRRLAGWKFRRQHPLGRYIADFYCAAGRLVVELDGPVHRQPDQAEYDHMRTQELGARGITVMRLNNEDVQHRLPEMVSRILVHLTPLHTVERGGER